MEQSKTPLWRKSIIENLDLSSIMDYLYEISENGDMCGYDTDESGYYNDYKEMFDELSVGAYHMLNALQEYDVSENYNDMVVAMLGKTHKILGYDDIQTDYSGLLSGFEFEDLVELDSYEEEFAEEAAVKRIKRFTKDELIRTFQRVLRTLVLFFDIKASHDCLTSVVEELDNHAAVLYEKDRQINILYEDLTGKNEEQFDALIENLPQRM